jgi:hypothetical protein
MTLPYLLPNMPARYILSGWLFLLKAIPRPCQLLPGLAAKREMGWKYSLPFRIEHATSIDPHEGNAISSDGCAEKAWRNKVHDLS